MTAAARVASIRLYLIDQILIGLAEGAERDCEPAICRVIGDVRRALLDAQRELEKEGP